LQYSPVISNTLPWHSQVSLAGKSVQQLHTIILSYVFLPRTSLALALSVSVHPNLLTRRIFLALLVPIFFILTLAPFSRTQRNSIRLAASASGTFGLILSISLIAQTQPWSNVWERLWIKDGNGWGTGAERALSAGYWLILISGCSADWALKKYCGGNPDEVLYAFALLYPT
jgi:hypothetical protein